MLYAACTDGDYLDKNTISFPCRSEFEFLTSTSNNFSLFMVQWHHALQMHSFKPLPLRPLIDNAVLELKALEFASAGVAHRPLGEHNAPNLCSVTGHGR